MDESLNYGDVCIIDETKLPDFDLYTFGSPCQDFSVSGKQRGAAWTCNDCTDDSNNPTEWNPLDVHYNERDKCPVCGGNHIDKSRSSLVVEALRIIRYKHPKYLLMENVKNLVGKQFKPSFDKIITELQEYGYNTYFKVLNAKNYGVPQNRERIFVISIRKDIDDGKFIFPEPFELDSCVSDYIVEDYRQLTDKQIESINKSNFMSRKIYEGTGVSPTLLARDWKDGGKYFNHMNKSIRTNPIVHWKLMGFKAEDFNKAKSLGISNTELYKLAGNSIVVDVLEYIFKNLFNN